MLGSPDAAAKIAPRTLSRKSMCHWASNPAPLAPVEVVIAGVLGSSSAIETAWTLRASMLLLMRCISPQPSGYPPSKMLLFRMYRVASMRNPSTRYSSSQFSTASA